MHACMKIYANLCFRPACSPIYACSLCTLEGPWATLPRLPHHCAGATQQSGAVLFRLPISQRAALLPVRALRGAGACLQASWPDPCGALQPPHHTHLAARQRCAWRGQQSRQKWGRPGKQRGWKWQNEFGPPTAAADGHQLAVLRLGVEGWEGLPTGMPAAVSCSPCPAAIFVGMIGTSFWALRSLNVGMVTGAPHVERRGVLSGG